MSHRICCPLRTRHKNPHVAPEIADKGKFAEFDHSDQRVQCIHTCMVIILFYGIYPIKLFHDLNVYKANLANHSPFAIHLTQNRQSGKKNGVLYKSHAIYPTEICRRILIGLKYCGSKQRPSKDKADWHWQM